MTPPDQIPGPSRRLHGDPNGEPLAVVLFRLQQIEKRMDRLLTSELFMARHEALQARVDELEREQEESARSIRQVAVAVVAAVLTAGVTAGLTLT